MRHLVNKICVLLLLFLVFCKETSPKGGGCIYVLRIENCGGDICIFTKRGDSGYRNAVLSRKYNLCNEKTKTFGCEIFNYNKGDFLNQDQVKVLEIGSPKFNNSCKDVAKVYYELCEKASGKISKLINKQHNTLDDFASYVSDIKYFDGKLFFALSDLGYAVYYLEKDIFNLSKIYFYN